MNRKRITLCVSGYLWNRSLVMMDTETESLWSHLLGKAMSGKRKGTVLRPIPCDMVTWSAWSKTHPETTVLNLPRTERAYTFAFYREPRRFALGWMVQGHPYHCTFQTLNEHPVRNETLRGTAVVVSYSPESTSARIYGRTVGDATLEFVAAGEGKMRDTATGSLWNRATGECRSGALRGKHLEPLVAIVSYTAVWNKFHPDSTALSPPP